MISALLWSIAFFLADLLRDRPQPPEPGESLRQCVENSLAQVEHQIWLHRSCGWYLLPMALAICGDLLAGEIRVGWLWVLLMAGWVTRGNGRRGCGLLLGNPNCYPLQP